MKYATLMLLLVKSFMVNGYGEIDMGPFQLKFEVPETRSFPSFRRPAFNFPAIYRPESLMQRDTTADYPDSGSMMSGYDYGGNSYMDSMNSMPAMPEMPKMPKIPKEKIKETKKIEKNKDGSTVITKTRDGPGFHSYIQEYVSDGGKNDTNGTDSREDITKNIDMSTLMSPMSIFNIMKQVTNKGKDSCNKTCKSPGKFCDQVFGLCRKKLPEGRTCMLRNQCQKPLKCVWGRCQKAKVGEPGTFCKKNTQCTGLSCCRNTPGSFHKMCIPQATEGSICGFRDNAFSTIFYVTKRSNILNKCNPCLFGLKCGEVGDPKYKRCVKVAYVEKEEKEISKTSLPEATNETGAKTSSYTEDSSGDDDDDNSGDGKDQNRPVPPVKTGPNESGVGKPQPQENENDAGKMSQKGKGKPKGKKNKDKTQGKQKSTG